MCVSICVIVALYFSGLTKFRPCRISDLVGRLYNVAALCETSV